MLKEAEEQRLEVLAAAGRYVSYNMCVCSYNCVWRFFFFNHWVNQDFLCAILFPFDLLMIPWDWFFTSQLNSWTDIPSAGEGGGGPAEGSDPLQGRRDDVRGSQVRQGHRHLLDHLQGRVGHHPQRGVHAGVQGGAQSHCHSTHSSF